MSGDTTYQALERLTYMPERDASDNGLVIGGQKYYDVYFTGGYGSNLTLENVEITNPVLANPLPLQYGGTGASLSDPGADRLFFWDSSDNTVDWMIVGSGLSISGKTISVTASGAGDVIGPASSTDNAIARFDGTTGKAIQNSGASIDDSGNISANNLSGTNTGDQTITLSGDLSGSGVDTINAIIANNAVSNAKFRQSTALTVVGRASNSTGNVADISASTDNQVLRRSGTALGFGAINLASSDAVSGALDETNGGTGQSSFTTGDILYSSASNTLSKLAIGSSGNVLTVSGGVPAWGAGSFDASVITSGTVATARLGSGTPDSTTFLRGDQTYAVPLPPLTSNSIGSQVFAIRPSGVVAFGTTYAGAGLAPSSSAGNTGAGSLSGTWRALGTTPAVTDATLFIRIS